MTQTTRSMALQTGEIDIAYNLKNENIAEFENNSSITIEQLESLRSTYAFMNQNGPLGDLTLRQALLRGLNKEAYCGNLLDGGATPGKAPVPPTLDFGFDQLKDENAYDPREREGHAGPGWLSGTWTAMAMWKPPQARSWIWNS